MEDHIDSATPRPARPWYRRPILWIAAGLLSLIPLAVAVYVMAMIPLTPSISDIRSRPHMDYPAVLLSSDGRELAVFRRTNREWVKLADISPNVVHALLATEDRRFYDHNGIDVRRTISAAWHTFRGDLQGGSTITQQLARNLYPEEIGRAPNLQRKVKEAITALKIESVFSKDQIMEMYLNTVPFLYNAYGIEMAARTYFDKSASELGVLESATLIGMLKGTTYYNPVINPERAVQRRNIVLSQLVATGNLKAAEFDRLKDKPLGLNFARQEEDLGIAPHLAQYLKQWLIAWADRNGYNMYADGLVVRTTIDSRMQEMALDAVARQGDKLQKLADADRKRHKKPAPPKLEAAFMALEPATGQVRAWVGSRDFREDQFDHVQQARRQPGSTFKPFVYGTAFAQGISPGETLIDQPMEFRIDAKTVWKPGDVHESTGLPTTLRDGLVYSKNTITAQLVLRVGPANVAQLARAMGVRQSKLDVVPSLALGTSPVTLKEMVSSYGSIANGGRYVEPMLVSRVENRKHQVLEDFRPATPEPALDFGADQLLVDVMRGVVDEGTGAAIRSRFGVKGDVAGKTGTTQDNTDGWFILMHPQLVSGAWVGFNDSRETMADAWGQGAHNALLIVGDFMQQAQKAKALDVKARFTAPHNTYEAPPPPDPSVLDRMNEWLNTVFQSQSSRDAQARSQQQQQQQQPPGVVVIEPTYRGRPQPPGNEMGGPPEWRSRADARPEYAPPPPPPPPGYVRQPDDGGIRILREGRPETPDGGVRILREVRP